MKKLLFGLGFVVWALGCVGQDTLKNDSCNNIYEGDKLIKSTCYYSNGDKKSETINYKDGKYKKIDWYENGKKKSVTTPYKKIWSKTISWDENGKRSKKKNMPYMKHHI